MHKVTQYLYRKQFHNRMSIGKVISLNAIMVGFLLQQFNTTILLVGILGILVDLLLNRSIEWDGYPEDIICPVCKDGELNEKRGLKKYRYKGQDLILPDHDKLVCDNCAGVMMKVGLQDVINKKIKEFKQKVDDGE